MVKAPIHSLPAISQISATIPLQGVLTLAHVIYHVLYTIYNILHLYRILYLFYILFLCHMLHDHIGILMVLLF